jgi:hypothetical protein
MVHARRNAGARLVEWRRACAVVVAGIVTAIGAMESPPSASAAESGPRINIATAVLARPASEVALPVRIEASERLPPNSFVRVRGLPPSVSLTDGFAIGPGVWAVPLFGLAALKVNVPVGVSGQSDVLVTLVDVEGTIFAEATSILVVGPSLGYRPPGTDLSKPWLAEPSEEERESIDKHLARGVSHLAQGNIASAREFFQHAAEAGLGAGATLLATTYDAVELQRMRVLRIAMRRRNGTSAPRNSVHWTSSPASPAASVEHCGASEGRFLRRVNWLADACSRGFSCAHGPVWTRAVSFAPCTRLQRFLERDWPPVLLEQVAEGLLC